MKKIIFRADGNSDTGLGHLYRIFALIEIYKEHFDCLLLTKDNTTKEVIPARVRYENIPNHISTDDEPKWISEKYSAENTWVIADGYQFTAKYQQSLKIFGYKLVYIDDLCNEEIYADIVINHSLAVKPSDYRAQSYTQFALGTKYAILRPLFLEASKLLRKIEKMDTAFVCFGGADTLNLTLKATQALLKSDKIKKINIALGAAYKHKEIFEEAQKNPKISVWQNISEKQLVEVMNSCDFGIAPASNILYEICAVQMPVLSGYYVANQKNIYKGALENRIIFDGGDFEHDTTGDFVQKINALLAENNTPAYLAAQKKLFDGKIKERFLCLLSEITYRRAELKDLLLVFEWANDQVARANSYNSEAIQLETHKAWFEKKMKDKKALFYIAEVNHKSAALVRYEITDDQTVVGILVGKDFRSFGLAGTFLKQTADLYFKECQNPVFAYIKQENAASIKSFEHAKYKKVSEAVISGVNSFVYQLKKS